ncbi:MAG: sigma-54 dependent transcriptional regulator, acetoin dehydrogenase operon transcriptional [Pseudomonadota bacterium]|nr:sigma-54 dependent transcriptional regulator, acetoin dehydrogenase operon transcriptional [Pseudomonadota bacterium]
MTHSTRPAGGKPPRLKTLRHALGRGTALPVDAVVDPLLQRSWQRSRQAGLTPAGQGSSAPHASAVQLARAQDRQRELIDHARPVLEFLFEQTHGTDSVVLLADDQGMVLDAIGDTDFSQRAARVALRPGAIWNERLRGTNAIGTCLAEEQALIIHGDEHYLDRNGFLTCAASPIIDPAGRIIGAIDISGDHRQAHRHTLGLVRSAARMIEQRLFETRHAEGLRLRFHPRPEGIASLTEGLMALSDNGWLIGANAAGLSMLGLERGHIGALRIEALFGLDIRAVEALARQTPSGPHRMHTPRGPTLWLRVENSPAGIEVMARCRQTEPPALPPSPNTAEDIAWCPSRAGALDPGTGWPSNEDDALEAFALGDACMRQIVTRLRRLGEPPIGVVLQGESGTGKSALARAIHQAGARREAALQTLHCGSLDEAQLDDQLFGRPLAQPAEPGLLRRARGGTLVLEDIAELPLPLQARLLRAIQDDLLAPLPGEPVRPLDVALVCTSRARLIDEVACGRLREDLYYRLNGLTLILPPLRERSDLAALCRRLLDGLGSAATVDPALLDRLKRYAWPGNVRQLANALRAACAQLDAPERLLRHQHLPDDLIDELQPLTDTPDSRGRPPAPDLSPEVSAAQARRAVADCEGNLSAAARQLGISRTTLYRRLRSPVESAGSASR